MACSQAPAFGARARDFEGVDHPCDAATALRAFWRCTGDIIRDQDRFHFDVILHGCLVCCCGKIHDIAAVITEQMQHSRAAMNCFGDLVHLVHGGGCKDITDCAAIDEARTNIAQKYREMT